MKRGTGVPPLASVTGVLTVNQSDALVARLRTADLGAAAKAGGYAVIQSRAMRPARASSSGPACARQRRRSSSMSVSA